MDIYPNEYSFPLTISNLKEGTEYLSNYGYKYKIENHVLYVWLREYWDECNLYNKIENLKFREIKY